MIGAKRTDSMTEKTLSEYNKKILYRITKVIFFSLLFASIVTAGGAVYENSIYYPYNEAKTRISCVGGYSKEILKSSYGITGNTLTLEQKKRIGKEICGANTEAMDSFEIFSNGDLLMSKNTFFTASKGLMEEGFRLGHFMEYFLLSSLIILGAFEVIRRVFYYIIFGTFRPRK